MEETAVYAPVSLLLNPDLTPSAKVLWMALRHNGSVGVTQLAACSGLTRPTVRTGLAQLFAAGWCTAGELGPACMLNPAPSAARVLVPDGLLADTRVGAQAKVLYGALQGTPGFRKGAGQFTCPGLCQWMQSNPKTVRRAVRELVNARWLRVRQESRKAPVQFTLGHPEANSPVSQVEIVRRRLKRAPYGGEAIMREYLSILVDSKHFEDDAAPGFLVNPLTQERLQFDRFYPPGVAFEFNGRQHYEPTEQFTAEQVALQQARDLIKQGICVREGIQLVVVHSQDLSLKGMLEKVGHLLPLREFHLTKHSGT